MKHTYSAAIRIALRAALCITCVVSFSGCFGSGSKQPKKQGNPLSLSNASQEDWNMANDFMAHPAGQAPQTGVASGTTRIPSAPTVPPPVVHPEVK